MAGAHVQRGGRLGDARGEQLRAVALAAAARGLRGQPLHLLLAHGHRLQVLARKQHLRGARVRVRSRAAAVASRSTCFSLTTTVLRYSRANSTCAAPGVGLGHALR